MLPCCFVGATGSKQSITTSWALNAAAVPRTPDAAKPREQLAGTWHLLTVREIADTCQLSEKAVRRAIDSGELPAVKLRSRLRVTPQDFEAWLAASRQHSGRPAPPLLQRAPHRPPACMFRALMQSEPDPGVEQ